MDTELALDTDHTRRYLTNAFLLIFRAAEHKGKRIRRQSPSSGMMEKESSAELNLVHHATEILNQNKVSAVICDSALYWFNNVHDEPAWDCFCSFSHRERAFELADLVLKGGVVFCKTS